MRMVIILLVENYNLVVIKDILDNLLPDNKMKEVQSLFLKRLNELIQFEYSFSKNEHQFGNVKRFF